jgi:hypothetical protein
LTVYFRLGNFYLSFNPCLTISSWVCSRIFVEKLFYLPVHKPCNFISHSHLFYRIDKFIRIIHNETIYIGPNIGTNIDVNISTNIDTQI